MTSLPVRLYQDAMRRLRAWWTQRIYDWYVEGMIENRYSDPRASIGKHTYAIRRTTLFLPTGREQISIGKYCSIAEGVRFIFGEHALDRVATYPLRTLLCKSGQNLDACDKGPILLGNDVWIGTNALILSGVTIGHGAVVAAGAVVTKDVPPYTVVGGTPARPIRQRFTPEQIADLIEIAWWDWPEEQIKANIDLFYGDVDDFIRKFKRGRNEQGGGA